MAGEGERRTTERRSGDERRAPSRSDPLPRRAQFRRQADVLANLSASFKDGPTRVPQLPCLDATALHF
ncbi:MAG: hypothetical protein M3P01_11280 [Actinomycetota bacterium]|nr:hypothetical protein [Actinomycetota bacterium]